MCVERIPDSDVYVKPKLERHRRHIFTSTSHDANGKTSAGRPRFVYHLSVIDYLQDYHFEKKFENFIKKNKDRKNAKLISAVPPADYAERFKQWMKGNVFIDQYYEFLQRQNRRYTAPRQRRDSMDSAGSAD